MGKDTLTVILKQGSSLLRIPKRIREKCQIRFGARPIEETYAGKYPRGAEPEEVKGRQVVVMEMENAEARFFGEGALVIKVNESTLSFAIAPNRVICAKTWPSYERNRHYCARCDAFSMKWRQLDCRQYVNQGPSLVAHYVCTKCGLAMKAE